MRRRVCFCIRLRTSRKQARVTMCVREWIQCLSLSLCLFLFVFAVAASVASIGNTAADTSADAAASDDVVSVAPASVADVIVAYLLLFSYSCMLTPNRAWIQESRCDDGDDGTSAAAVSAAASTATASVAAARVADVSAAVASVC